MQVRIIMNKLRRFLTQRTKTDASKVVNGESWMDDVPGEENDEDDEVQDENPVCALPHPYFDEKTPTKKLRTSMRKWFRDCLSNLSSTTQSTNHLTYTSRHRA
jgi:hypothetical protein